MDYAYVTAEFEEKDILVFSKIIKELCNEEEFYYSDIISYIKGDVSSKMHLTLFYGLIHEKVDQTKIKEHIKKISLKNLKLGKLSLMSGYQKMYKLLIIEVLDENNELRKVCENFKKFPYEKSVQHNNFKPHLTLAYVKPEFTIRKENLLPNSIQIKEIKYYEK